MFGVDKEEFDWQVFLVLSFDSQCVVETGRNSKLTRIELNGRRSEPKTKETKKWRKNEKLWTLIFWFLKKSHFKNCPVNTNFLYFCFIWYYAIQNLVILYNSHLHMFMILLILLLLDGIYMKNNNATINHNQNWWKFVSFVYSWRKLKQSKIENIKK